ncbi:MAG: ribonuclease HI family protein [Thermodesulfobacteriota bacterium]
MANDREKSERFLAELADTLDLQGAMCKFALTDEEASVLLRFFLSAAPAPPTSAGKKKLPKPPKAPLVESGVKYILNVDGASRGNPGPAGAGAIIKDPDGNVVRELRRNLGTVTNNVAEYEALILALEEAASIGCTDLSVFADSELMVKQINGLYKVKNEGLKGLYAIAKKFIETFDSFEIAHVRREFNGEADRLANEAIDGVGGE